MAAFTCSRCKKPEPDRYRQYAERMEYRRTDAQERRATWTERLLCQRCVDELVALHEHGGLAVTVTELPIEHVDQGSLL